jgi:hypothetical protein
LPTLYCSKSISLNSSLNNIAAIKLDAGGYVKAEESALSLDLKMEGIKAIQQEILQSDIFKKLGESKSSKVDYYPHKHTNSSHQPPLLNQGLSTSLTKGLDI